MDLTAIDAALANIVRQARRHPEFDDVDDTFEHEGQEGGPRSFLVNCRFDKNGSRIFVNPHQSDSDYDWPEFVGHDILETMVRDAASLYGLALDDALSPVVSPSEKGWVRLGFHVPARQPPPEVSIPCQACTPSACSAPSPMTGPCRVAASSRRTAAPKCSTTPRSSWPSPS